MSDRSLSIVSRKRKQTQTRLSDEEVDTVIAGYQEGLTLKELSSAVGAHHTTLARRLDRRGVARRGPRLTDEQVGNAAALYRRGWSLAKLSERFGVYPESIRYRLLRVGVEMRDTRGRPKTSQRSDTRQIFSARKLANQKSV